MVAKLSIQSLPPGITNTSGAINAANQSTPEPDPTSSSKTKKRNKSSSKETNPETAVSTNEQNYVNNSPATIDSGIISIVNDAFPVKPGGYRYYQFTLVKQSRISGRVEASGGSNDIDTIVLDADEFVNFQNTGRFRSYFRSGYVSIANIDLILGAGDYYVVFSNSAALLTNKLVKANVVIE